MWMDAGADKPVATRPRNSGWIWLGVLFLPFAFSWLTLRKGWSNLARAVAFGWLAIYVACLAFQPPHVRPVRVEAEDGRSVEGERPIQQPALAPASPAPPVTAAPAAPPVASLPAPPPSSADHTTQVSEARAFWSEFVATDRRCSQFGPTVARAARAGSLYAVYGASSAGHDACRSARSDITTIPLPPHASNEVQSALQQALSDERGALDTKEAGFADIAHAAVTASPSSLALARQEAQLAGLLDLAAAGELMAAFKLEDV